MYTSMLLLAIAILMERFVVKWIPETVDLVHVLIFLLLFCFVNQSKSCTVNLVFTTGVLL